jgi:hypothetical protein
MTRLSVIEIPREIREQEREIESIFRSLIRFREVAVTEPRPRGSGFSTERTTEVQEQEVAAWVFITVLGLTGIIGFGLLWIYCGSGC